MSAYCRARERSTGRRRCSLGLPGGRRGRCSCASTWTCPSRRPHSTIRGCTHGSTSRWDMSFMAVALDNTRLRTRQHEQVGHVLHGGRTRLHTRQPGLCSCTLFNKRSNINSMTIYITQGVTHLPMSRAPMARTPMARVPMARVPMAWSKNCEACGDLV